MRNKSDFAPQSYITLITKQRNKRIRQTAVGVLGMTCLFSGVLATTDYGSYLSAKMAEAATPITKHFSSTSDKRLASSDDEMSEDAGFWESDVFEDNGCNVLGLSIIGDIGTYYGYTTSDYIESTLDTYKDDERVKAILLDVDSPGGSPVGGDEIRNLIAEQEVPVVAHVREQAASAAYMAILSADRIFSHKYGSIGSIGVIIPRYDFSEKNVKDGIKYDPIKTGAFKDMGSEDRPLTDEERAIFQAEIDYIKNEFANDVAVYRTLPIEQVQTLADGKSYLAHKALELGLIDEIGSRPEVLSYLEEEIGEKPVICWQ